MEFYGLACAGPGEKPIYRLYKGDILLWISSTKNCWTA